MLALFAAPANGQAIRGLVLDSASRSPVAGVVVSLLDESSAVLGRIITNERGQFNVPNAAAVRRLRTQRIGFRLREVPIVVQPTGFTDIEVRVASLPTLLEAVRVIANNKCPSRPDREKAYALLDQARAGLLATVVARAENSAVMRILGFERFMDDDGKVVTSQRVRLDSGFTPLSFASSHAPGDFISHGFVRQLGYATEFSAPDAEVLLSEEFAVGYCFRLVDGGLDRVGQVGLGFDPASRPRGGNAITGGLWIDTVARALVDLEYRYLDVGAFIERVRPGGRVFFTEVRPGIVLIDRWSLRLPRPRDGNGRNRTFIPFEAGAELASARWGDGVEWRGNLGALRISAHSEGAPVANARFRIDDSDYEGVTDSTGVLELRGLLPGPYTLRAVSAEYALYDLHVPPALAFVAARDSTIVARVSVPTLRDYVAATCAKQKVKDGARLLVGTAAFPDGRLAIGEVRADWFTPPDSMHAKAKLGVTGRFEICLSQSDSTEVTVTVGGRDGQRVSVIPSGLITPVQIVLGRPPSRP